MLPRRVLRLPKCPVAANWNGGAVRDIIRRPGVARRLQAVLLASSALCMTPFLAALPAAAQDATWIGTPVDGDYNNAANWNPATVPVVSFGVGPTASFGASSITAITMAAPGFSNNIGGIT